MTESTVSSKDLKTELIPPEGHKDVGFTIFQILDEILEDKSNLGLPAKWNYYYKLGKNKHWKAGSKKTTLISANLLHTHRTRTVNMLTDNNPTFNITKIGSEMGENEEVYDDLLHAAQYWWIDQEQQDVLEESVYNGETYGCCIEKVIFNSELEFGLGEAETLDVDPFHFGLYPVKTKKVQKAQAVLHYWPMSLREARRKYPDYADKIKADEEYLKELGEERRELTGGKPSKTSSLMTSISNVIKHITSTDKSTTSAESSEVLIVECWCKDYSTIQDSSNGEKKYKYKGNIRCITTCNAGELVLKDRDNPSINPNIPDEKAILTYLYDKFPFSRTPSNKDTSNPWGSSDFEQLSELVIELGKNLSRFNMYVEKAASLKLKNPKNSGVPNSHFTNGPGIINPANHLVSAAIGYMETPRAPSDVLKAIELYKDFFSIVAGMFDLDRAQQVSGGDRLAYKSIAALIELATTMTRGKIRNYSKMIRERGRMYQSHVQNWYTEARWISWKEDGEEQSKQIKGEDLIVPAKLAIVSGSTMPVSQIQKREEAIRLREMGDIDQEELLKALDWPDRKVVINRMIQGPLSQVIDAMAALGTPQPLLSMISELSKMEPKDIEKAIKSGQVPSFEQLIQQNGQDQGNPAEDAKILLDEAKAQETHAKIELIGEQIMTERVQQRVMLKGIDFDEEKLKIERAGVISKLEIDHEKNLVASYKQKGTSPYREKGMKSNNQRVEQ